MAVAFDATSSSAIATTSSLTWSHTCTGTNPKGILAVAVYGGILADLPATITYGSKTSQNKFTVAMGATDGIAYYSFFSPPVGAATITVTPTASILCQGLSQSYTGCNESIDSKNSAAGTSSPLTATTTVVATNCWLIGAAWVTGVGLTSINMTTGTKRVSGVNAGSTSAAENGDSNATVGTGSQSLVFTAAGTSITNFGAVIMSIEPYTDTYTNPPEVYISQPVNHFFPQSVGV